jgi:hypothetical protein
MRKAALVAALVLAPAVVGAQQTIITPGGHVISGSSSSQTTVTPGAQVITTTPQTPVTGTVVQVDPSRQVIVLDGGRTLQITGDSQIMADGRPVVLQNVQPGSTITVVSGGQLPAREIVSFEITDVDRDGELTLRAPDGDEFEMRVSPAMASRLKRGDTLQVEITGPGAPYPAASPRLR